MSALTVGITTRNRPAALERCVRSLARLQPLAVQAWIFDDASEPPVAPLVKRAAPAAMDARVIRDDRAVGNIAGRNRLVREAEAPFVLLLDDDAVILERAPIERAMQLLAADPRVAAVAFAQGEADGRPWPERMQPARARGPVYVPAFIGFAHLIRRDTFLALGGYRESLVFYGEEKDFCVRALDAGHRIVYLPDAIVGHVPDPGGRSATRYVRFVIRNDCLYSLYNEPWPLAAISLPIRLWRYRRMAAPNRDSGGLRWIARELAHALPSVRRERRPVSWATIREWRRLARTAVPYVPPAS
ncbi:MAG TPA: glycosyltransferase [Gemmatimonadaceae bacterium]|nr:glycosyltransferase [Gemmatimonadaceae bacterium]